MQALAITISIVIGSIVGIVAGYVAFKVLAYVDHLYERHP